MRVRRGAFVSSTRLKSFQYAPVSALSVTDVLSPLQTEQADIKILGVS